MSANTSKTSPLVVIAAISVIIFSGVGVAVMTGLIPSSFSKNETPAATASAPDTAKTADATASDSAKTADAAAPEKARTEAKATDSERRRAANSERRKEQRLAANDQAESAPAHRICADCGVVESVKAIEHEGQGSGLGVVAGGVVGALLGNQVGNGNGRAVATIAGAAGGAYAGNAIEKNAKKTHSYEITVRMEDGKYRTFTRTQDPGLMEGDKVKVEGDTLVRR